jgi:hypothetical protein
LRLSDEIDADFEKHAFIDVEPIDRVTYAFQKLADNSPGLALLLRYESTLNRSHDRAFKQLQILQSARNHPQPNEPKPARRHPYQPQPKQPIPGPLPARATVTPVPLTPATDSESPIAAAPDSEPPRRHPYTDPE